MGHLVLLVLPESEPRGVDTHADEQLLGCVNEICQHTVGDDSPLHRFLDGHGGQFECRVGYEIELLVLDLRELRPVLVLRIHEEFDLHLVELPHPDHSLTGCDLVPVAPSCLDDTQRELLPVVSVQIEVVDEDTLCRLRPEVSDTSGTGSDVRLEHEVEFIHGPQVPSALGALDVVLHECLFQFLGGENVGIVVESLDHVVGPEGRLALLTVCDEVGEVVHVSRCLEDILGVDRLRVDLYEPFPSLVDCSPCLHDVVLEYASERSVVEHTGDTAVDLE